ncbi:NAD(P)-dependent dehydrogenase, short-chain alcohol dehydrogenase family [Draconibacterium orientale]|jgi:NAD(P)-dependent dehydrogenase (short-subunit alcohol dehydrogenase family)|uniref:D-mannonate oxidoreductase n=1 Tax=Draconibacterium orientale TaxID=1168034 RepID=X5DII9_9BACT|nr:SDR family oxidoreductase [Draconibacterium orientale]AHW60929.1 D-mannonate oxidoreductase [Draconibacterium orientale]SES63650.1 NAD(P)-dependent dehydrogenase, short-chain alcohol dehydrogenase family [Draconibacterium orientale]
MQALSFNDLKDKVCVITGGAGVLGTAMVKAIASVGTKIAIADINKEVADKVAAEIAADSGTEVIGVAANVLDKESLEFAKTEINKRLGPIDILINGAGGNSPQATTKVETITEDNIDNLEDTFYGLQMEGFDKVFALNFTGTLLPTMVFTRDMLESRKGVVLNVSSMNSYKPLTKIPAYSAAKASINNFTEWLSVHLAKVGIRVNAIAPGFFITHQNRFLVMDEKTGNYSPRGQKIVDNTPMGKFGEPEDLQGATLFLISDVSNFITGIVIPVDGGYSAFGGV